MALKSVGGYWHADVKVNGRRVRVTTGCRLDQEELARVKEQEIRRKLRNGTWDKHAAQMNLTLRGAFDRALAEYYQRLPSYDTAVVNAKRVCEFLDGDMLLSDIDEDVLIALVDDVLEEGLSGSTANRYLSLIGRTMRLAIKQWRSLSRLPYFPRQPESEGRIRVYSVEEEERMVATLRASTLKRARDVADLIEVLFDTGARLSEGLRMHETHYSKRTGLVTIWKTKTKKPRSVPVLERSRALLERRFLANGGPAFDGLTKDRVESVWVWLRKQLGEGADFVIHGCRHTCATRLLEAGNDIYLVQKWLGHTDVKTTQRYVHLTGMMLSGAKDKMETHRARLAQFDEAAKRLA